MWVGGVEFLWKSAVNENMASKAWSPVPPEPSSIKEERARRSLGLAGSSDEDDIESFVVGKFTPPVQDAHQLVGRGAVRGASINQGLNKSQGGRRPRFHIAGEHAAYVLSQLGYGGKQEERQKPMREMQDEKKHEKRVQ